MATTATLRLDDGGTEIELSFERGRDGIPVLFIDTPEMPETVDGPVLRVRLNDEPIHENPPLLPET